MWHKWKQRPFIAGGGEGSCPHCGVPNPSEGTEPEAGEEQADGVRRHTVVVFFSTLAVLAVLGLANPRPADGPRIRAESAGLDIVQPGGTLKVGEPCDR